MVYPLYAITMPDLCARCIDIFKFEYSGDGKGPKDVARERRLSSTTKRPPILDGLKERSNLLHVHLIDRSYVKWLQFGYMGSWCGGFDTQSILMR